MTSHKNNLNSTLFRQWACIFCLFVGAFAHAEPVSSSDGAPVTVSADTGLINRIGDQIQQVGQSVGEKASELVFNALGVLGVPYRWGGSSVETGFDCSGFVRAMYEKTLGLVLPRRADQQAAATQAIDRADLQPGDLVFFNTMRHAFSHVGIYLGDGKFIHAPRSGSKVRVEDMQASYWLKRFNGARRVAAMTAAEAAPPR